LTYLAARGSRLLCAVCLTALPLSAQLTVDRSQPLGGNNYYSITLAVGAVSGPGTTITIFGDGSATGVIPYSDVYPGYPESFPIVVPAGTTLTTGGSLPVYVWNTNPSAPDLFTIQGAPTLTLTRIIGLNLLGGDNAIMAESNSSTALIKLQVKDCRFAFNKYGVTAIGKAVSGDGYVECSVRSATFGDSIPATTAVPPFQNKPTVGIRFHSDNTANPGVLGEVIDLSTVGNFAQMAPAPPLLGPNDLAASSVTRLVEVFVGKGDATRVEYPGALSGNYAAQKINEAIVTIQGGDWNGGAPVAGTGGWDIGLFAQAQGFVPVGIPFQSFTCGYQVTMTGATLTGFREEAIYADGTVNGRGLLTVNGGSILQTTGQLSVPFDEHRYNGIHVYSVESYMGVTLANSQLLDNRGNGLYARNDGEHASNESTFELGAPFGIYLDIQKDKIHRNEANGIYLREEHAAPNGFIGGTIHQDPNSQFNIDADTGDFLEPNGQGILNRCAISNNGKAGFRVLANGDDGTLHGAPFELPSGVALRISNAMIWNNPEGGISSTWDTRSSALVTDRKGYYLVPVTHSTLVGNGGPGFDWSIEIDDQDGTNAGRCRYERIDPGSLIQYRTNLWNDIFVRDPSTGTGNDFGNVLNNVILPGATVKDIGTNVYGDDNVAVAGCRAIAFWQGAPIDAARLSEVLTMPFIGSGGYNLSSTNPGQFYLDPFGIATDIQDFTPLHFHVLSPESSVDFNAQRRPLIGLGTSDKGTDED